MRSQDFVLGGGDWEGMTWLGHANKHTTAMTRLKKTDFGREEEIS